MARRKIGRATRYALANRTRQRNIHTLRSMGFDWPPTTPDDLFNWHPTRDSLAIAKRSSRLRSGLLQTLEDLRHESPHVLQDSQNISRRTYTAGPDGVPAPVVQRDMVVKDTLSGRLSSRVRSVFADTGRTLVCVRRRARRAVLLALSHSGRGAAKPVKRRARWSEQSYIDCK